MKARHLAIALSLLLAILFNVSNAYTIEQQALTIEKAPNGARVIYKTTIKTNTTISGMLMSNISVNRGLLLNAIYMPKGGTGLPFNITIYIEAEYEKSNNIMLISKSTVMLTAGNNTQKLTIKLIADIEQNDPRKINIRIIPLGKEPSTVLILLSQLNESIVNSLLKSYGLGDIIEVKNWTSKGEAGQEVDIEAIIKEPIILSIIKAHLNATRLYTGDITIKIEYKTFKDRSWVEARVYTKTNPNLILNAINDICNRLNYNPNNLADSVLEVTCMIARDFNITESKGNAIIEADNGTIKVEVTSPIIYYRQDQAKTKEELESLLQQIRSTTPTSKSMIAESKSSYKETKTKEESMIETRSSMSSESREAGYRETQTTTLTGDNEVEGKKTSLIIVALTIAVIGIIIILLRSREHQ